MRGPAARLRFAILAEMPAQAPDTLVSVLRDAASRKSAVAGCGEAIAPSNRPTKMILAWFMNC